MNLLDIFIKIGIDDSEFERGISNAQTQMGGFSAFTIAKGNLIAEAFKFAANAIFDVAKKAFEVGSEFEASMSKVQAVAGASSDELVALTDKALEMGQKTKYSASEAADALYYMAQAGWNTQQMTEGLAGVMNLAAASGEDLATTSDIVTDAMTAFGMSADESVRFADVLTKAANDTNTSVGMLGETFKYVAPVAGTLGYSVEDVAIATGLMANAGVKSSQAGTSLRRMLTNLVSPTDKMAAAMSELGISITGKGGEVKPLYELLVDLREGFSGLTEAEQAEYASIIASQTGMSGLLAIVNATDDEFDRLTDSMYQASGAAEHTAKIMQDNLKGRLEELSSAAETFYIKIYQDVQEPLKDFAETATDALNEVTEAYGERGLVGALSKGAEIIGGAFESAIDAITDPNNLKTALDAGASLIGKISEGASSAMENFRETAGNIFGNLREFITDPDNIENALNIGGDIIKMISDGIVTAASVLGDAFSGVVLSATDIITDPEKVGLIAEKGTAIVTEVAVGMGKGGIELATQAVELATKVVKAFQESDWEGVGNALMGGIKQGFMNAFAPFEADVSARIEAFFDAIHELELRLQGIENTMAATDVPTAPGASAPDAGTAPIPESEGVAAGATVVVQNIYSQEHSAAELMEEARLAQDRGRLYMLN